MRNGMPSRVTRLRRQKNGNQPYRNSRRVTLLRVVGFVKGLLVLGFLTILRLYGPRGRHGSHALAGDGADFGCGFEHFLPSRHVYSVYARAFPGYTGRLCGLRLHSPFPFAPSRRFPRKTQDSSTRRAPTPISPCPLIRRWPNGKPGRRICASRSFPPRAFPLLAVNGVLRVIGVRFTGV